MKIIKALVPRGLWGGNNRVHSISWLKLVKGS